MINPSETKAQADHRMLPEYYRGCSYFGLADDADTRVMFPIYEGTCHRAEPSGKVELTYQQTTCLTAQHQSCPVFLRHHKAPLPPEISGVEVRRSGSRRVLLGVLVIFLFALIGTLIGLWWAESGGELEALIPASGQETAATSPEADNFAAASPTESPTAVLARVEPMATSASDLGAPVSAGVTVIESEPMAVPTLTAQPTDPPTPSLPPTYTPIPLTSTPLPTNTEEPGATAVVDVVRLNLRRGPNTAYEALALLDESATYEIIGRISDNSWLQLCCVNGQSGWVITEAVIVNGDLDTLPIISEFPPLPATEP